MTPPNSIPDKPWLITGGCGFIGINLIRGLIQENHPGTLRILDNFSVGNPQDLEKVLSQSGEFLKTGDEEHIQYCFKESGYPKIEVFRGDIRNRAEISQAITDTELVVHLAASTGVGPSVDDPMFDMESNVVGTVNLLEASREHGVGKFIFASSGAPIGETEPPIHEEKAPHPVSPYGASKLAGEGYCSAYFRTFGIKTIALRFGNVYGPYSKNKSSVVAKFLKQALNGETLEIYGDGKQTRDFIYVDDLVQAILLAAQVDVGGEVFQIATHRETTVNEIGEAIKDLIESETGNKVEIVHGKRRLGDVERNFSDISKARNILGFEPQYDLKKGLEKTFKYFILRQAAPKVL